MTYLFEINKKQQEPVPNTRCSPRDCIAWEKGNYNLAMPHDKIVRQRGYSSAIDYAREKGLLDIVLI